MKIDLKILPDARLAFVKIKGLSKDFQNGIRQGFWETGKILVKRASDEIKKKKSGNVYVRVIGKQRKRIAAGIPGGYPANVTGANRRSLDFKVHGYEELEFGAGMKYSPYLELGTRKMEARPFLLPTIYKEQNKLKSNLKREIERNLKKP